LMATMKRGFAGISLAVMVIRVSAILKLKTAGERPDRHTADTEKVYSSDGRRMDLLLSALVETITSGVSADRSRSFAATLPGATNSEKFTGISQRMASEDLFITQGYGMQSKIQSAAATLSGSDVLIWSARHS